MQKKNETIEKLNEMLREKMKSGVIPWKKSWKHGIPRNFVSKKAYQGMNFLFLSTLEFPVPEFLTFLQCKEKGGMIKKGAKGCPIVFYKIMPYEKVNESTGEIQNKQFPLLKQSYVFNLSDTTLYKPEEKTEDKNLNCEDILNSMEVKPTMTNNLGRCYYNFKDDYISLPLISSFETSAEYYAALFHEIIHWTGHESRLNRDLQGPALIEKYSFEELIAEIGSSYLCAIAGIEQKTLDNSAAYLKGWLTRLDNDYEFIAKASIAAQKAVNFVLKGLEAKEEKETEVKAA